MGRPLPGGQEELDAKSGKHRSGNAIHRQLGAESANTAIGSATVTAVEGDRGSMAAKMTPY